MELQIRGGPKAVKKTSYRKETDERGGVRWIKGFGGWDTWLSFLRKMAAKYADSPGVKDRYEAKAGQWNADHPRAPAPDIEERPMVSAEQSYLGIGEPTAPVRTDVLKRTVAKWTPRTTGSHPTAQREPGPVRAARAIHTSEDGSLFIQDPKPPGKLPSLTKVQKTCGMVWPGFCAKLDDDVAFIVKDICQNLNTLCAGRRPADLHGRIWRLDFLMVRPDSVGGPSHKHTDLFLGHVRLQKPQVQIFAPLQQRTDTEWTLVFKPNGELYVATSYKQLKLIVRQIFRFSISTGQQLNRVWLHELFAATKPDGDDLVRLKRVPCQRPGLEPLMEDLNPLNVWPGVIPQHPARPAPRRPPGKPLMRRRKVGPLPDRWWNR
jgi:hypothetical protein